MILADQRHRDSVKAEIRKSGHLPNPEAHAQSLQGAAKTGKGAADQHGHEKAAGDAHPGILGCPGVEAGGANLKTQGGPPENEVTDYGGSKGNKDTGMAG